MQHDHQHQYTRRQQQQRVQRLTGQSIDLTLSSCLIWPHLPITMAVCSTGIQILSVNRPFRWGWSMFLPTVNSGFAMARQDLRPPLSRLPLAWVLINADGPQHGRSCAETGSALCRAQLVGIRRGLSTILLLSSSTDHSVEILFKKAITSPTSACLSLSRAIPSVNIGVAVRVKK